MQGGVQGWHGNDGIEMVTGAAVVGDSVAGVEGGVRRDLQRRGCFEFWA